MASGKGSKAVRAGSAAAVNRGKGTFSGGCPGHNPAVAAHRSGAGRVPGEGTTSGATPTPGGGKLTGGKGK